MLYVRHVLVFAAPHNNPSCSSFSAHEVIMKLCYLQFTRSSLSFDKYATRERNLPDCKVKTNDQLSYFDLFSSLLTLFLVRTVQMLSKS